MIIKALKRSVIISFIVALISTLFNIYQKVALSEQIKIAVIVFLFWFVAFFILLLLLGIIKQNLKKDGKH